MGLYAIIISTSRVVISSSKNYQSPGSLKGASDVYCGRYPMTELSF